MSIAVFGAGCFWCVEAIFAQLAGVESVISGYTGGHIENPTYEKICTGNSGHAEVCKISFNPDIITYENLLEVLFTTHDPTTINQQGADIGNQYRSAIFYTDEIQRKSAIDFINKLNNDKIFNKPIVTEVEKLETFYEAENYHQDYYKYNSDAPYCKFVIKPKLDKFLNSNDLNLKK